MDHDELIQQGMVKRIFRAKRKLTVPNIVSHVNQRSAGKEPLFLEDSAYLYMLANMKDIIRDEKGTALSHRTAHRPWIQETGYCRHARGVRKNCIQPPEGL